MPKDQSEMEGEGFNTPKIKAIEDAAEDYVTVRDKRMKLTDQEVTAKTKLIDVCKRHIDKLPVNGEGEHVYTYDEEVVILTQSENVRVKHAASVSAE
jgi:hypothetical protein